MSEKNHVGQKSFTQLRKFLNAGYALVDLCKTGKTVNLKWFGKKE